MPRFNFTNITLEDEADITDVMDNFNEIEGTAAIVDDLPKVSSITIQTTDWTLISGFYEVTISNNTIKAEPYIIEVFFDNLTIIKSPINPKPNSQSEGSIKLITKIKPTQSLTAKLIVTRGINQ